ncbi:MAG: hypothetical protein JXD23_04315 [Spirochaetales bacterium]|nr:hypothetical protein [Spirochaetales bacterium]
MKKNIFKLKTIHKSFLQRASHTTIEDYFVSLPTRLRGKGWVFNTNRYKEKCTSRYENDLVSTPSGVKHRDLISYISASAPTHIIDGWSYLGRAIDATLRGDTYSAIHFGYYSELRAAMGLLASEGIGIFNTKHAIADYHYTTHKAINGPTHRVIWPILRHWSTLRRAADLLDKLVMPNSIKLSVWLTGTRARIPIRAVARHWLCSWGLDLKDVSDDHDWRNLASYRPSEFRKPDKLNVHEQMVFVEELWQLFEPNATRRFPKLENHLLKRALHDFFGSPTISDFQNLGLTAMESSDWIHFLNNSDDPRLLSLAEDGVPIEEPTCHLRIISRAALLLFVASAAARSLLSSAGYSSDDILFWWGRFGGERALWNIGSQPSNPQDLWADIAQIIEDSAAWRANNPSIDASLHEWRKSQATALAGFGGLELVGIWALMP